MSTRQQITIEAKDLPNKVLSITYEVPTYGDYRRIKRIYPYPTREDEVRPPYTVEELLFADSIVKIEAKGKPVAIPPQDLASRLESFPIDDRQAAMIEFIGTCFLDEDQAKVAKAFASDQRAIIQPSVFIPSTITPSGRTYSINRPNTGTQWKADNLFKGPQENGCTLDELLSAMCLIEINGQPIAEYPKDYISLLDSFRIDEAQFIGTIFVNCFLLDRDGSEEAKSRGKQKKALLGKQAVESKRKNTTQTQETTVLTEG